MGARSFRLLWLVLLTLLCSLWGWVIWFIWKPSRFSSVPLSIVFWRLTDPWFPGVPNSFSYCEVRTCLFSHLAVKTLESKRFTRWNRFVVEVCQVEYVSFWLSATPLWSHGWSPASGWRICQQLTRYFENKPDTVVKSEIFLTFQPFTKWPIARVIADKRALSLSCTQKAHARRMIFTFIAFACYGQPFE